MFECQYQDRTIITAKTDIIFCSKPTVIVAFMYFSQDQGISF